MATQVSEGDKVVNSPEGPDVGLANVIDDDG